MRQIENQNSFILPSNPEDRKAILELFEELSNSMTRVDGEKSFQKEAIDAAAEKFEIPKKILRKAAKVYHQQNFDELSAEEESFQEFYEQIVETDI